MLLIALVLGIVEGLTEFLPVSSTGHLILAGHLLGFTGEFASTFEVFIQLGAILAVVFVYLERFLRLLPNRQESGFSGLRGLSLLAVSTFPALLLGYLAHSFIKEHLFNPLTVAIGLLIGGIWLIVIEKLLPKTKSQKNSMDQMTVSNAFAVGLFQCLALWPGMSRAAATLLGGMMTGLDRKTATEYSFFAAVPVLAAATLYDLLKSIKIITLQHIPILFVGFMVSLVTAFFVIRFFIQYVSRHSLQIFGWYRIVLAGVVFYFLRKI